MPDKLYIKKPSGLQRKKAGPQWLKTLALYLLSNIISIGVGKLLPLFYLPYWIAFCVACGYFINRYIFKK